MAGEVYMDSDSLQHCGYDGGGDDQMLCVSEEMSLTMQAKKSHFERPMKHARTVKITRVLRKQSWDY